MTNSVVPLEKSASQGTPMSDAFYTSFLNPQGRVIADAFLYLVDETSDPALLLDVDAGVAAELTQFLRRFKLRSKVTLKDVSEDWLVQHIWGESALDTTALDADRKEGFVVRDMRTPTMGWRWLQRRSISGKSFLLIADSIPANAQAVPETQYTAHRMLQGVPEGAQEVVPQSSLPLESCIDYMHGVDFHKGCYIGQELTARTYFTGLVRKRIVPVMLSHGPELGSDAVWDKHSDVSVSSFPADIHVTTTSSNESPRPARSRPAGKLLHSTQNVGLALLRLDHVQSTAPTTATPSRLQVETTSGKLYVHPWRPSWWPTSETSSPK